MTTQTPALSAECTSALTDLLPVTTSCKLFGPDGLKADATLSAAQFENLSVSAEQATCVCLEANIKVLSGFLAACGPSFNLDAGVAASGGATAAATAHATSAAASGASSTSATKATVKATGTAAATATAAAKSSGGALAAGLFGILGAIGPI